MRKFAIATALVALTLVPEVVWAQAPPVAEEQVQRLRNELEAAQGWRALAHVRRLDKPLQYFAPQAARGICQEIADGLMAKPSLPRQLAAAHLVHKGARYDIARGQRDAADAAVGRLALLGN